MECAANAFDYTLYMFNYNNFYFMDFFHYIARVYTLQTVKKTLFVNVKTKVEPYTKICNNE